MRAAVVGVGPHGRRLIAALRSVDGIELVAIADGSEVALTNAGVGSEVARHRDSAGLWASGNIDLVCIATNAPSHAVLASEAMRNGARFILVEKPMACSIAECETLLELASRTRTRLVVGHHRRRQPIYRWLREEIRSGAWGAVRSISMQRPGIGLGCNGTHSFDLVRFLTDGEVRQVTGWVDAPIGKNPRGDDFVDPGGLVVMEMKDGVKAVVTQIEDGAGPMSMEMHCTAGRVRLDEKSGEVEIVERDLSIPTGPDRPAAYRTVRPPDGLTARADLAHLAGEVIRELVGEGEMDCDAVHGRASIEVLVAAYCSNNRGHLPVSLPLVAPTDRKLWLPVT